MLVYNVQEQISPVYHIHALLSYLTELNVMTTYVLCDLLK